MRTPCCEKMGLKKGPWTPEEDEILVSYVRQFGHENWRALPMQAGLQRCGKSCRLRWSNYLRPDIKRGNFSLEEEETISKLHQLIGNRWSAIATKLPGRTDNEIKNFWHTRLKKRHNKNIPATKHITGSFTKETTVEEMPAKFSNHARSLSHPGVSIQEISNNFTSSESSSDHYKCSQINALRNSSSTAEIQGASNHRNQFLCSEEPRTEPVDDSRLNVNNDMVFWYNLLIKAGETQNG